MKPALGTHANGLSPTQSVLVVQMGVLLANVKHRGSDAKLIAGDATNGDGGGAGGMPMGRRELRMCVWYTWACSLQM